MNPIAALPAAEKTYLVMAQSFPEPRRIEIGHGNRPPPVPAGALERSKVSRHAAKTTSS